MNILIGCGFLLTMAVVVFAVVVLLVRKAVEHGWMYSASLVAGVVILVGVVYWLVEVWAFGGSDE
jgi:hypothetical protein